MLQKELKWSRLKSKTTGAGKAAQNKALEDALVTNDDESKFGRTVVRLYTSPRTATDMDGTLQTLFSYIVGGEKKKRNRFS